MQINKFIVILICLVSHLASAQGWLGKDLSNINVKELTTSQRDEVLRAAKRQGFNEADLGPGLEFGRHQALSTPRSGGTDEKDGFF
jgi:hypothetical protein